MSPKHLAMIRWVLNRVPRGVLQRLAGWTMPIAAAALALGRTRKNGVECPVCGGRFRRFLPYGYVEVRKNALCPRCLALERHRLLWLWLEREGKLAEIGNGRFLHVAPEVCLSKKFERIFRAAPRSPLGGGPRTAIQPEYVTADLESPLARVKMDVQAIPFPDDSFDVVFCNHVLEHVADDRLAMRELHRVTRRGGWGLVLSPVDETRGETFEDDSITDPAERTRVFGQYDHRRIYGRDYADRLREAGFTVDVVDFFASLTPAEQTRHALRRETLYVVSK